MYISPSKESIFFETENTGGEYSLCGALTNTFLSAIKLKKTSTFECYRLSKPEQRNKRKILTIRSC